MRLLYGGNGGSSLVKLAGGLVASLTLSPGIILTIQRKDLEIGLLSL